MFTTTKYGFSPWQGDLAHSMCEIILVVSFCGHIMVQYSRSFAAQSHYKVLHITVDSTHFNIEMMKPQNLLLMCHEAKLTVIGKTIFCCSGG
jgi:type IV secretory pathway VirB6-like protein